MITSVALPESRKIPEQEEPAFSVKLQNDKIGKRLPSSFTAFSAKNVIHLATISGQPGRTFPLFVAASATGTPKTFVSAGGSGGGGACFHPSSSVFE